MRNKSRKSLSAVIRLAVIAFVLSGGLLAIAFSMEQRSFAQTQSLAYTQQPDGTWINVATGRQVVNLGPPYWPGQGVTQYEHQVGPGSGGTLSYAFIPCPPAPTPTPTPTPTPEPNPKIIWDDPFDLFFGYAYNRAPVEAVKNLNGFHINPLINVKTFYKEQGYSHHANPNNPATRRVPKWSIGIDGDFTGGFGSQTISGLTAFGPGTVRSTLHRYLYLIGPQFNFFPSQKTRVFIHPLFGGVHDTGATTIGTTSTNGSASAFAMAFGGGIDIAVNQRIAVRPFEFNYLPTHFGVAWQNNFEFSTGLVFRFRKKH